MSKLLIPGIILFAVVLVLGFYFFKQSIKQGYAILPSDYGLSPMNRSPGFVKPFSIQVDVPPSLKGEQAQELSASSQQQVLAQQSANLQVADLSPEQIKQVEAEVQPQVEQQKREVEELLSWWIDYSSRLSEKIQSYIYSLSGFLQDPMSIQHYGLSQDHVNVLKELKIALKDTPPENIMNYDAVIKYVAPVLMKYQNQKLENVYPGLYSGYDWVNVV